MMKSTYVSFKTVLNRGLIGAGYVLVIVVQAFVCAEILVRHIVYDCYGGDWGPGGGFSMTILLGFMTLLMSVIGYQLARYLRGALRSRGAGSWSALGACFMLSPVLPIGFWEVAPLLA